MPARSPRAAAAASIIMGAGAAAVGQSFRLAAVPVASGIPYPVALAAPPGDPGRLFIAQYARAFGGTQPADVFVLDLRTGLLLPEPFVTINVYSGGESGLLGIAFDPQYQSNHFVYLHHSNPSPQGSRIVRYTSMPSNPDRADPSSATEVFFDAHQLGNHQGGWTEFGSDGYLYFSIGNLQLNANSQSLANLYGKICRIDVRSLPYTIPPTNPFFGSTTARQEIIAYGLRNPWRVGIDRATGDLLIGDVGENTYEEVDFLANPASGPFEAPNYGWPCSEGPVNACPASYQVRLPIFSYQHDPTVPASQYITGGYVYRGAAIPELRSTYFFWKRGPDQVWSFRYDGATISELTDRTAELRPAAGPLAYIVSFGQDTAGELYMASFSASGTVYKIVPRCWANCDGSTGTPALGVGDFSCFLARFAAADPYANCDGSTGEPVLNVDDFVCFQQRFAAGCP